MKTHLFAAVVAFGCLAASAPVLAHHPFAAEFDSSKSIHLSGTVSKMDWSNPHAYLFVDVKDEKSGATTNWKFELGSPNALQRRGWKEATVKTGDKVTVNGWQARDGSHFANAKDVMLSTGKELNAASSYYDKAPAKSGNGN
jgi:hypothetical protein